MKSLTAKSVMLRRSLLVTVLVVILLFVATNLELFTEVGEKTVQAEVVVTSSATATHTVTPTMTLLPTKTVTPTFVPTSTPVTYLALVGVPGSEADQKLARASLFPFFVNKFEYFSKYVDSDPYWEYFKDSIEMEIAEDGWVTMTKGTPDVMLDLALSIPPAERCAFIYEHYTRGWFLPSGDELVDEFDVQKILEYLKQEFGDRTKVPFCEIFEN